MDLYSARILFEFKHDKNFLNVTNRASVTAQALYYMRRLKFGKDDHQLPPSICIVDKNEAFFVDSADVKDLYSTKKSEFDWDRAPSSPCPRLVERIIDLKKVLDLRVYQFSSPSDFEDFSRELDRRRAEQLEFDFDFSDKKVITEHNFESAFDSWRQEFGGFVSDEFKPSQYFKRDLVEGTTTILEESNEIVFDMGGGKKAKKSIPTQKYEKFWSNFEKVSDPRTIHAISQRLDRLSAENFRRRTGEFYTPIAFAEKAIDYLVREVGERWWERGFRLWDMAAGTGNLEYELPEESLPFVYISTLLERDADYCSELYPEATVFQYDYLNDDVAQLFSDELKLSEIPSGLKLPPKLLGELADPDLKWIVFINPPFSTANVAQKSPEINKDGVSMTEVRRLMERNDLGETSRELFSQFLWRINREFNGKRAFLGMFSTLKYINSNNDHHLREQFFGYEFCRGFCLPARSFHGNKGQFPIGFLIWNLKKTRKLSDQQITIDIFDVNCEKIGTKTLQTVERDSFLSKWVDRPRTSQVMPPFSSGLNLALDKVDTRDRVADGFLFSMQSAGNSYQHRNLTYLLSGPAVSAGACSVTPENFERSLVVCAVRLVREKTWLNDRDQWYQPVTETSPEFVSDCVIWSVFSDANQTVSLRNVAYKGKNFDLTNQLFPLRKSDLADWDISLAAIRESVTAEIEDDRFLSGWLAGRELSAESAAVLSNARQIFRSFYRNSATLAWPKFSIQHWDVGWYQVRRSMVDSGLEPALFNEFSLSHDKLRARIDNQLEPLGFVSGKLHFFEHASG